MIDLESASSGGIGAALVVLGGYALKAFRASRADKKHEIAREDKRLTDCEDRFKAQAAATAELGKRLDVLNDRYTDKTVDALVESTRAMTSAAESQREGNIAIREQNKAIGELAKETARLVQRLKDSTPAAGLPAITTTPPGSHP